MWHRLVEHVIRADKKWHLTSEYLRIHAAISDPEPYGPIYNSS